MVCGPWRPVLLPYRMAWEDMARREDGRVPGYAAHRYFVEGAADEAVRLVAQLNQEQAIVTSAPDAIARLDRLHARLNEIDAYFTYELSMGQAAGATRPSGAILSVSYAGARVDVFEKYKGALADRPIPVSMRFVFGPEHAAVMAEVQDALDYGYAVSIPRQVVEDVTLDAPGGLGGSLTDVEIDLRSANTAMDAPIPLWFDLLDGDRLLASWRADMSERLEGFKGFVLTGQDHTGWLNVRLEFNVPEKRCEYRLDISPKATVPAALVPRKLRWARDCRPPYDLVVRWDGVLEMRKQIPAALLDAEIPRVVEALAYLQERSGVVFPMPLELSPADENAILGAEALSRGESVDFTWKAFTLHLDGWGPGLEALLDGKPQSFRLEQNESIQLSEGILPIGRVRTVFESARVPDAAAVRDKLRRGSVRELRLVPGGNDHGRRDLVA